MTPHITPEQLALIALGEEASSEELEHLTGCASCALEIAELADTVRLSRASAAVRIESPSPEVWGRIQEELQLSGAEAASDRKPIRPRAVRWWVTGTAIAASIGLIVALVGGLWFRAAPQDPGTIVARAALEAFPGWPDARGNADVEVLGDGERDLVLHVDGADPQGSSREVWLIAADASRLVSLGVLDGDDGRFRLPADLDLAAYPLVDVSAEPDDDDPTHSGDSIVRGELELG